MRFSVILPYLKTTEAVTVRGLSFKNSTQLDGLEDSTKDHLLNLFSMFFLKDEFQITEMSYACVEAENDEKKEELMRRLEEAHDILGYIYSAPHQTFLDTFLKSEHANLYIFTAEPVLQLLIHADYLNTKRAFPISNPYDTPNERDEIPGYKGMLNNESHFWVAKGSRIYPPSHRFWLNQSQDLYRNMMSISSSRHEGFSSLIEAGAPQLGTVETRIFIALKWYNRSNLIDIADDAALLNLAIAFESLLGLEQGPSITRRFGDAIKTLVGPITKIESWASQFYRARSEIVHKGSSPNLMFYATSRNKGAGSPYRQLVAYGREIFRISLNALIAEQDTIEPDMTHQTGLESLLVTNRERFELICNVLNSALDDPSAAILSIQREILDIEDYKFVPESDPMINTVLAAVKLAAAQFVKTDAELLNLYSSLAASTASQDHFEDMDSIAQICNQIGYDRIVIFVGNDRHIPPISIADLVFSLTKSVYHYTYMRYYQLKRERHRKLAIG